MAAISFVFLTSAALLAVAVSLAIRAVRIAREVCSS